MAQSGTVPSPAPTGIWASIKSFTAVDIVTVAVLAVLFRVGMFPFRLTGAFFPYNICIRYFIDAALAVMVVLIVRKQGALMAYALTWWLINFTVEGEDLVWLIAFWPPIIAAEMYLARKARRKDLGELSGAESVIGIGVVYAMFIGTIYWVYLITYYQMTFSVASTAIALALIYAACIIGALVGRVAARRIRALL